jgi:hypothetical protein
MFADDLEDSLLGVIPLYVLVGEVGIEESRNRLTGVRSLDRRLHCVLEGNSRGFNLAYRRLGQ